MTNKKQPPEADMKYLPRGMSKTPEEEKAYRRGFDQGLCAGLRAAGLDEKVIHDLEYKQRIVDWRYDRLQIADPMKVLGHEMLNLWGQLRKVALGRLLNAPYRLEMFEPRE